MPLTREREGADAVRSDACRLLAQAAEVLPR